MKRVFTDKRIAVATLVCLTLGVFLPAVRYEFTHYDDLDQLTKNPTVQALSLSNLARMFTSRSLTSYYPIRVLSLAIDHALWGMRPGGYHLTNVLIHTLSVVLVFALVLRLATRLHMPDHDPARVWVPAACAGAALFAVHPVVVEQVVWIAGREELLAGLFMLLCLLSFDRALAGARWMFVPAGLFAGAACLSNVLGAVIAPVAAAYAFCARPAHGGRTHRLGPALASSWFFWTLAALTIATKLLTDTVWLPPHVFKAQVRLSLSERIRTIFDVYARNLGTLVWPRHLYTPYANDIPERWLEPRVLLGAIAVVLTPVGLWFARRRRAVLFGGLWFLAALAPSAQLVPHHIFRADRFLYLPLIGLAVAGGAGLARVPADARRLRPGLLTLACLVLAACVARTALRLPLWRNGLTLFSHAFQANPDSPTVRANLGTALARAGRHEEARRHFYEAARLDPANPEAHFNLANALRRLGRLDEAVQHYSVAVFLAPTDTEMHTNLGVALSAAGKMNEAIFHYSRALRLAPENHHARVNLGAALGSQGKAQEALRHLSTVVRAAPYRADARINLGITLLAIGDVDAAVEQFRKAVRLQPHAEKPKRLLDAAQAARARLARDGRGASEQ